ncbi:hypothetical protein DEIPH_ctg051orf0019 [Deinococcus phoenicis]|uniref:General stress protein 17M-like domain-containing protein n=1 Tax=Deinococcus phoenicis TaxID=1476583 RepID=A0A016QMM5_9DEIO|nr:hypothetical protein [Deinococcus phoenicis]EYB67112.1 hypothetical protein DEIPH_ctg051orf0019 [Deinococcus phoenicis]
MKHLLFPSQQQADAFIEDLRAQGLIQPEIGNTMLNRRGTTTQTTTTRTDFVEGGGTAEDAGEGAIEGTGVGAAVGAVAGVAGAVATVATGGLALPVILGMTALGAGVGAGVGAIGGAAGVDETGGYVEEDRYDRLNSGMSNGGRAIAVEDSVPADAVEAAAARHGGQFV